ncbi:MAG TPA: hypothetical protein VFU28_21100 [Vicinamibacterales bacterium]|nr:hypothetical protein [Vicinamibacterales bacterium]
MIELNSKQRALIADKLFDVANVGVGGMVFGQFLSDHPFSVLLALTGLGIWVTLFVVSVAVEGRTRQ